MTPRWQAGPPQSGEPTAAAIQPMPERGGAPAERPGLLALLYGGGGEEGRSVQLALSQLVELCHSNLVVCRTEAQIAASRRAVQSKLHELDDLRCGAVCYAMHG